MGKGWRELSLQEKGQVANISPALLQHKRSGTLGSPRCSIPPCWQLSSKVLAYVPLAHQPTQTKQRQILQASRERLSQLSQPVSVQLERCQQEPAGASSQRFFLPVDIQVQCGSPCLAPELCNCPTHPIDPAAPPSLQDRQRAAPATKTQAEAIALITKGQLKQIVSLSSLR